MALDTSGTACAWASREPSASSTPARSTGGSPFELAVVVIGRNEGPRLARCLRSVQAMDEPDGGVEIVYVDSASRDGSVEVARRAGVRVIALTDGPMSAARARNAGWRAVTAPFVFFVDGDCVVEPEFARRALTAMADRKVALVWGTLRECQPRSSVYHRFRDVQLRLHGREEPEAGSEYITGIGLFRRSVLAAIGGYEPALTFAEDREIGRQVVARGWSIRHLAAPMVRHDCGMASLSQYWRRCFRKGYGLAALRRYRARQMVGVDTAAARWATPMRTTGLGVLVASAVTEPYALGSCYLGLLLAAAQLALIVRAAWRARARTGCDLVPCLLFGVHHQGQRVPMLAGRLAHWYDRRRGRERGLIEWR